jgi:hypothetical protein
LTSGILLDINIGLSFNFLHDVYPRNKHVVFDCDFAGISRTSLDHESGEEKKKENWRTEEVLIVVKKKLRNAHQQLANE